jgi:hypothetical protein
VLLTLGANHSTNRNKHSQHTAEICTTCCCATPVRPMALTGQTNGTISVITSGQASGNNKCAGTFQEASLTLLGPVTKTTSKTQTEGNEKPLQNLANQLENCQELTRSNTAQSYTCPACTCNTRPRVSPHNIFNHLSHQEAIIHRSSNHTRSHKPFYLFGCDIIFFTK